MFNFEIDTLEIALDNYCGYADVLLVEGSTFHNPKLRAIEERPRLWPIMRSHERFRSLSKVVKYYVLCKGSRNATSDKWESERAMDACMSRAASRMGHTYKNIVVASIDEILSRKALRELSTNPVLSPTSSMVGMFMARTDTIFKSDWPSGGNEFSFALPTIYPAETYALSANNKPNSSLLRVFRAFPGPLIRGGAHLTNYCFWPNRIIKLASTTSYSGEWDITVACSRKSAAGCYRSFRDRTRAYEQNVDTHAVVPTAVTPTRYPAWFGKNDPREEVLFNTFC
jgi:hypothetical protein